MKNVSLETLKIPFGRKIYHTVSNSPFGPVASTEASLSPNVSNRRRHRRVSHCVQSVLVMATLDNLLAALQYGQTGDCKHILIGGRNRTYKARDQPILALMKCCRPVLQKILTFLNLADTGLRSPGLSVKWRFAFWCFHLP